ncbi:MAG: dGTP triphosphohydrolase [bacterium]
MQPAHEYEIYDRTKLEALEDRVLSPYARRSAGKHATRLHAEPEHDYRTAFQRDRDRIIHSRAFRRLKHKRQVFLTTESDHYRTRITHTLEVAQLSRTIARALGLNEDLVEAIALGHDLGHTPFGHLGEVTLNQILSGQLKFSGQKTSRNFGGFKHNYQSIRIVDWLEQKYDFQGLNLTASVREGILKHTRLKRGHFDYPDFNLTGLCFERDVASSLEGQVVAICDEIAQRTHDLEDGLRAGLVELQKVKRLKVIQLIEKKMNIFTLEQRDRQVYQGLLIRGLINYLVDDVIRTTLVNLSEYAQQHGDMTEFDRELVQFSPETDPLQKELNKFIYKEIIDFSRVKWSDELGRKLLFRLFEAYFLEPTLLPEYVLAKYFQDKREAFSVKNRLVEQQLQRMQNDRQFFRLICDHIAGMTDNFAIREAQILASLNKLNAEDLHLELAQGKVLSNA